jgi:glycerate dehydrogenase
MQAVFLDKDSLDKNDLDFTRLLAISSDWQFYDSTSNEEVKARTENAEVIVSNKVVLDKTVISNAQKLKLICVAATGTNNVDIEYAKSKGIQVCNVRAYGTQSVVQHVFTLLLMLMRNIPQYQAAIKREDWQKSNEFCLLDYPIEDLTGKTMGIIGYGELGKAVAKIADAFGMQVLIANHTDKNHKTNNKKQTLGISLEQLLKEVDVLSLHCPLTEQTKNLIGESELALMKPSSYLINMARGGIVDELALKDALIKGRLAGAAIDVLAEEPPQKSSPLLDIELPQLIITPHIAWASRTARQNLLNQVAENIERYYSGSPKNIIV